MRSLRRLRGVHRDWAGRSEEDDGASEARGFYLVVALAPQGQVPAAAQRQRQRKAKGGKSKGRVGKSKSKGRGTYGRGGHRPFAAPAGANAASDSVGPSILGKSTTELHSIVDRGSRGCGLVARAKSWR